MASPKGPNFEGILPFFCERGVRFILIGGGAAAMLGSARLTYDVDLVYARDADNIDRLVDALTPHQPYLRGAPRDFRFVGTGRPSKRVSTLR